MKIFCKFISGGGKFKARTSIFKGLASLVLISSALTACNNEADDVNVPNNHLKVNFGVAAPQSRAIFTGTELPEGSIVGAKLDGYDDYAALTFTATGTGESRSWSGNKDVILTDTKGTLYSFYPQTGAWTSLPFRWT